MRKTANQLKTIQVSQFIDQELGLCNIKRCVKCVSEIKTNIKTRNKKYCEKCRVEVLRTKKRDWKRNKVCRKNNELKCLDCGVSLGDIKYKRYCSGCIKIRYKVQHEKSYLKRKDRKIKEMFGL